MALRKDASDLPGGISSIRRVSIADFATRLLLGSPGDSGDPTAPTLSSLGTHFPTHAWCSFSALLLCKHRGLTPHIDDGREQQCTFNLPANFFGVSDVIPIATMLVLELCGLSNAQVFDVRRAL